MFPAIKTGIPVSTLSAAQQTLVLAAIKTWIGDLDAETAACLLTSYQAELGGTYISYAGNASLAANGDYVRIDGPGVWIELFCQTGVVYPSQIHYLGVYRDHKRDYGAKW